MRYISRKEWALLICLFVFSFVPVVGGALRIVEIAGGPVIAPNNLRINADPLPALLHLLGAIPFCILGAFQFLPSIRKHAPKWHRCNGWIVIQGGIVSSITGLWMTQVYDLPVELQGGFLYFVRMVMGTAMTFFILLGLAAIRKRRVDVHSSWMIRAYAIGQGASTQTLMGLTWIAVMKEEPAGFPRDVMMTLAWVVNLMVAEWIIRKPSKN